MNISIVKRNDQLVDECTNDLWKAWRIFLSNIRKDTERKREIFEKKRREREKHEAIVRELTQPIEVIQDILIIGIWSYLWTPVAIAWGTYRVLVSLNSIIHLVNDNLSRSKTCLKEDRWENLEDFMSSTYAWEEICLKNLDLRAVNFARYSTLYNDLK